MVTINIEKRHLYLIAAMFVFLVGVGVTMANWPTPNPPVWHDSSNVKLTAPSGTNAYTLQEIAAPAWWSGMDSNADGDGWVSNWRSCPSSSTTDCITLAHSLGTTKLLVYVQVYSSSGNTGWSGVIHNYKDGSEWPHDGGVEGIYWKLTDTNNIQIIKGVNAVPNPEIWNKVRVFIWKIAV